MTTATRSKPQAIKHLGEHDSWEFIALEMKAMTSFRTWENHGLRSRSASDYYEGFVFDNPGQLPEPYAQLYRDHAESIMYTVFLGNSPIAWYSLRTGWVAPKLTGFASLSQRQEYEKVQNAVLMITGKGGMS